MIKNDKAKRLLRRTFLAGAGTTAAAALLRPLFAAADAGSPKRLLIVHRPCGTRLERWFPVTGGVKDFEITPLLESFTQLRDEMVILNQVDCPRDITAPGDHHGAGMMTMMTGRKPIIMPGTSDTGDPNAKNFVGADISIDQLLLQKATALQGTPIPSLQLTAYRPSSTGLPVFRVVSYSGKAAPLFPESRPDIAFSNVFGSLTPDMNQDPATLARLRDQNKSVLDYLSKDMNRLYTQAPAAQRPKLDAHLTAIRALESDLASGGVAGKACMAKPTLATLPDPTGDLSIDEAQHDMASRQQLQIIKAAFQCDLTRVATFSFAHGNSYLRFQKMLRTFPADSAGHHDISHEGSATAQDAQAAVDKYYSDRLAELVTSLQSTPEGTGTMLDNTLVVYFNEVSIGADHNAQNMPVLMFGGKALGLNRGSHLKFAGRYMTDVWSATGTAFGAPMASFGDAPWNKGPVPDSVRLVMKLAAVLAVSCGAVCVAACEPQAPDYVLNEDSGVASTSTSGAAGSDIVGTAGSAGNVGSSTGGAGGGADGGGGIDNSAGSAGSLSDAAASTGQDATKSEAGGGVDVTATATFHASPSGSAAFTQHGVDVTVTVKLTNCSMGNHPIFIYEGFSCDSTATEGNKWDGARANLGDSGATSMIACKADQTGLLTYTRLGADVTTRWTVSDHNLMYDVSNRVVVVSDVNNEATRQSCADFR